MTLVVGGRLLKPQRLVNLTLEEEKHRTLATWQDFDFKMYMMCFGPLEWLEPHVFDPQSFRNNLAHTIFSWSDQIPFWIKIRTTKQLYAMWELSHKGARNDPSAFKGSENQFAQTVEGMNQKRGNEPDGGDRYRVTLEVQHDVLNFLNPDLEPVGRHGKALLILIGVHARLSNIGDDGKWVKDEVFEYKGKPHLRKAGTSARGVMKSWVALRKNNPKAKEMLEKIEVMQQPSGFQDAIISKWRIEQQAEEYPQGFHVRDLNASYLSGSARQAAFLSQQIAGWIAGKMTAVMQPTDTDFAFPLKGAATRSQNNLRRELLELAREAGVKATMKCGPYEQLRIAYECTQYLEEENLKKATVLKSVVRDGFLAYRPDFEKGCLVKASEQKWFEDLGVKLGNHRMKASWVEERYNFLDKAGKPLEANWEGSGPGVTCVEDMEDVTQHGPLGTMVRLECCKDTDPEGVEEGAVELECDVDFSSELADVGSAYIEKQRGDTFRRNIEVDKFLTPAKKVETKGKAKAKVIKRAKIKESLKILLPAWRAKARKDGLKCSRKQLLEALVPGAGLKGKQQRILQDAKEARLQFFSSSLLLFFFSSSSLLLLFFFSSSLLLFFSSPLLLFFFFPLVWRRPPRNYFPLMGGG